MKGSRSSSWSTLTHLREQDDQFAVVGKLENLLVLLLWDQSLALSH